MEILAEVIKSIGLKEMFKDGIKASTVVTLFIMLSPSSILYMFDIRGYSSFESGAKVIIGIVVTMIVFLLLLCINILYCMGEVYDLAHKMDKLTLSKKEKNQFEIYKQKIYMSIFFEEFIIITAIYMDYFVNSNVNSAITFLCVLFAIVSGWKILRLVGIILINIYVLLMKQLLKLLRKFSLMTGSNIYNNIIGSNIYIKATCIFKNITGLSLKKLFTFTVGIVALSLFLCILMYYFIIHISIQLSVM